MDDLLTGLDAIAQAELVRRGDVTTRELVEAAIARIELTNPHLNYLAGFNFDRAVETAERRSGRLAGVPFLIKDLLGYPGMRFSLGCRMFADNTSNGSCPYVDAFDAARLVTLGKTTTSEFGLIGSTETTLEGVTRNPWDPALSPAGSSGGAGAAVACGAVPVAHASDGGGSIRIPASVCGLFGLKPSRGRTLPTPSTLDVLSDHCVSRTVRDSALLLALTEDRGRDAAFDPVGFVDRPSGKPERLTIAAYLEGAYGCEPEPGVREAVEATAALCEWLGHRVEWIPSPHVVDEQARDSFFIVSANSINAAVSRRASERGKDLCEDDVEPFTWSLLKLFESMPEDSVARAQQSFNVTSRKYRAFVDRWDAVLSPVVATDPWPIGELGPQLDFATLVDRTRRRVGYTPFANIAGCPAMSVPTSWNTATGLPVGSHFVSRPGAERLLLELAYELEEAAPWADRWPQFSVTALTRNTQGSAFETYGSASE